MSSQHKNDIPVWLKWMVAVTGIIAALVHIQQAYFKKDSTSSSVYESHQTPQKILSTTSPSSEVTDPVTSPKPSFTNIPGFPVGTSESVVKTALGKPTKNSKGYWNTHALSYQLIPNQIELGYLFDPNSGRLRQTEVSFGQSVDIQIMLKTLNEMLDSSETLEIQQGLEQVQQRRVDKYTFKKRSLKGMIVRQDCDVIYISIWDADLHDFDLAGARKC